MKRWLALSLALVVLAATTASAKSPVVAAVGDIACPANYAVTTTQCQQRAVAASIEHTAPDSLWLLGDIQYQKGGLSDFKTSFAPAFSKLEPLWRPAPGNHEYGTPSAAGYFDFFGLAAGPTRRGYYAFNIGRWHVVSLNSNCVAINNCGKNSPQANWLRADLRRNKRRCTAAFWHRPMYSSGSEHGSSPAMRVFWKILESRRADLVLSGHDHDFEEFPRLNAYGGLSSSGMRSFVVGTGGRSAYPFGPAVSHSQFRRTNIFGFLKLKLNARSYDWSFVTAKGAVIRRGSARCS